MNSRNVTLDPQAVVRFIFEVGQLRQERRHGWLRIQENPESVAEHTQRAACLGYLLACLEGFQDPNRVATMILFHDIHEVRTGDVDRVHKRYVRHDEEQAARDQSAALGDAGAAILDLWKQVDDQSTRAGEIAKDAEILEMAFTARELVVRGNQDAQCWIDSTTARLKTAAARQLLPLINSADPCQWWKEVWALR